MSGKKRVILHIGMMKTGSTSLQIYLQKNGDALSEQRIGYYTQQFISFTTWANAGFLCWQSVCDARRNGMQIRNRKREMDLFAEFANDYDTLILSEEIMWEKGIEEEGFWTAVKSNVYHLLGEDTQIEIIVFLRRQDEWILSRWKESLLSWNHREKEAFPDYLKRMEKAGHLDYDRALDRISGVFGCDIVKVCGYNKEDGEGTDTTKAFLEATGIKLAPLNQTDKTFRNPSISLRTAQAMLVINKRDDYIDEGSRRTITRAAKTFSLMYPDEKRYYPMNKEERGAFLSKYNDINNRVSLKYNYGEDLFEKEIADYCTWQDDLAQSVKDADCILKLASISNETLTLIDRQLQS